MWRAVSLLPRQALMGLVSAYRLLFKAWLGEGGWNLNRWVARGDVLAVTKEQLDKLKLAY